ncbi:MAG: PrgI family protein [Actinomycetota bacterium]
MKVRVPADVDMADRVLAGLTARQVAILGAHALVLWGLWVVAGRFIPAFVFGVIAVPITTIGFVWATVKVEGTSLEGLAAAALKHLRTPRRRALAPEGIAGLPSWAPGVAVPLVPLELPMDCPDETGAIALGSEGHVVVCRASSINFALRSETEQRALVEAFGRLLNALDAPIQILIRSDRANLGAVVADIEDRAVGLPHAALEQAARAHVEFLRSLGARRDVLARQVLICFREPSPEAGATAAPRLEHRIEEAATLLRGFGIRLSRLEETEATYMLARACDPESPQGASAAARFSGVVEAAR